MKRALILLVVLTATTAAMAYEVKPCNPKCSAAEKCDTKTGTCVPKDPPKAPVS